MYVGCLLRRMAYVCGLSFKKDGWLMYVGCLLRVRLL
jgi:hypothetical protein